MKKDFLSIMYLCVFLLCTVSFKVYAQDWQTISEKDGLIKGQVKYIKPDKKGNLWFFSEMGFSKFDEQTWTTRKYPGKCLNGNYPVETYEDSKGAFWIFLSDNAIRIFEDKSTIYNKQNNFNMDCYYYSNIQEVDSGIIFVYGRNSDNFYFFNKENLLNPKFNDQYINLLMGNKPDKKGRVWNFDGHRLYSQQGEKTYEFKVKGGISAFGIRLNPYCVLEENNNIWFSSLEGLLKFDGKEWMVYKTPSNIISTSYIDKLGNIWFGCGVSRFKSQMEYNIIYPFNYTSSDKWYCPNSLLKNFIFDIDFYKISSAIGSDDLGHGGLVKIVNSKLINAYEESNKTIPKFVSILFEDSRNNIWLIGDRRVNLNSPYNGGIARFDGTKYYNYDQPVGWMFEIREDKEKNVLFNTVYGVCKFDGANFSRISESLSFIDSKNNIWFSTKTGINVYKDGKYIEFKEGAEIISAKLLSIAEDIHGNLWFATPKGVLKYSPKF